jgi:hypothetical protein
MDRKKFVSVFLVIHLLLGMAAISFVGTVTKQQKIAVSTEVPISTSATYKILSSEYSNISYDIYVPANYTSGSLVILAGGILGEKHYLKGWGETLANNGYAALAFSTKSQDLKHVQNYVDDCQENIETLLPFVFDNELFPISINQSAVSLVGMSGGGATVLSINDTRIEAEVAVCPYYIDDLAVENTCPTLIITGEADPITPPATNGEVYYDKLVPNKMITEQAGIGHDISGVGWKYTMAWLDYIETSDNNAYSTLASVVNDTEILSYNYEFDPNFFQQGN